jgi:hypothetical protein
MKRHAALIPLSRDHHDGLVQAVRLRRAAADGNASARLAAAREFVEFFRNEGVSTFGMRKKSSSRFSSGTSSRRLLPSARHASSTCSLRGSLANSTSTWRTASSIDAHVASVMRHYTLLHNDPRSVYEDRELILL